MAASLCRKKILNYRNNIFHSFYRTGYIVLIPESPRESELLSKNPSYELIELNPEYRKLKGDLCKQLFQKQCQDYDVQFFNVIEEAKKQEANGESVDIIKTIFEPLEEEVAAFYSSSGYAGALYSMDNSQLTSKEFEDIVDRMQFSVIDRTCNQTLFDLCKKSLETEPDRYKEEDKRLLQKYVRVGRLSGLHLPDIKKGRIRNLSCALEQKILQCKSKITHNFNTVGTTIVDENKVNDFPEDLLRVAAQSVEKTFEGPWRMSHHNFVHNRFLEYCASREHRFSHFIEKRKMNSTFDDQRLDISRDFRDIRQLRHQIAEDLGFDNYFDLRLQDKMFDNEEDVKEMLQTLLLKAREVQEREILSLENFAYERGFEGNIELWDLDYWARKQAIVAYDFDEIKMLDYFPLNQVLLGLFSLCEQLFGIEIKQQNLNTSWHEDVRYYEIYDQIKKEKIGEFYFDPYARDGKLFDEDMSGEIILLRPACKRLGTIPSVVMLFQFTPPSETKPSLLYFREVKSLFSKFGYLLQILLTEAYRVEMGTIFNIEGDAMSTCARFLENWCYERGTLESISGHYKTGEPLPKHIIDNMGQVQKHMAATRLCIDIYYSNLDIQLHTDQENATMEVVRKLWSNHLLFHLDDYDFHPFTFKETIYGPLTCSYYGTVWSKVMGLDAFSAFSEVGLENHEQLAKLGKRFRSTFLALGGTRHAGEVFKRFRGRNPSPYALIDAYNLDGKTITSTTNDRPTPLIST